MWVQGGIYNISGVAPVANVHLYGGFAGNETSLTDRVLSDKDGNGIIDPWEFTNETLLYIVNSTNSGIYISSTSLTTADKLIIDGFTITYTCTSATVPPIVVNLASNVGAITFQNNIIRNCALTGVVADGTTTAMLINSRGILKNCLFEKNIATITLTGQGATPFVTIVNSRATGCVFRNNKNTADYSTINYASNYNAAFRGMIVHFLSGSSGAISNTSLSTSLFYNNELNCIPFKDRLDQGLNNASVVGYGIYSASYGTDSVVNCIFASNKGTLTCYQATGMYLIEQPNVHHYVLNNVFWNNSHNMGGNRNFKVDVITSGLISNNVMNAGNTYTASTYICNNLTNLDTSNDLNSYSPQFSCPTTMIGNTTNMTTEKSDWRIPTSSYLVGKGIVTTQHYDKVGNIFISPRSVGAFEGVSSSKLNPAAGTTIICELKDNKRGAYTFTTDDDISSAVQSYSTDFKRLNLRGSMALVTSWITDWTFWSNILADGHFDVTNHTTNHIHFSTITSKQSGLDSLNNEINIAQTLLKSKFPGQDVITIANPWIENTTSSDAIIKQHHYAGRNGATGYNSLSPTESDWFRLNYQATASNSTVSGMNSFLNYALRNNKWVIILAHGIGTSPTSAIPQTIITPHFEYVASKLDSIWCGTFNEVTKYIKEKQHTSIQIKSNMPAQVIGSLIHDLDPLIFNFPLTIKTVVPSDWTAATVMQNGVSKDISTKMENNVNNLYYDVLVNAGDVQLTKKQQPNMLNIISTNSFRVYPNPLKGHMLEVITKGMIGEKSITITALSGKIVFLKKLLDIDTQIVSLKNIEIKGTYIVKITNQNSNFSQKLLVQ